MSQPLLRLVWVSPNLEAKLAKGKKQNTASDRLPADEKADDKSKVDWSPWTPVFTVTGTGVAVISVMVVLFLSLSNRLNSVDTSLALLSGRLEPIFNQYYQPFKKLAEEKGYQNAGLLPVNLVYADAPIDHPPASEVKGKVNNLDYEVLYELIKLTATTMTFKLNGRVGTNVIKDNRITVPLKLNEPIDITAIHFKDGPRFFVEVIALPSANIAMIALGPKQSKTS